MTPKLSIRSFSNDQYNLDKVFYSNHYKLKGSTQEDKRPVILDIGAHCGYFSFAALALGASKVYSFEIHPENYKLLLENLDHKEFKDKLVTYNIGVYSENCVLNFEKAEFKEQSFLDYSEITLTPNSFYHYPCLTLDYILKNIIQEEVSILKINIGYAEISILSGSSLLDEKVKSICLEVHEDEDSINSFISDMNKKGYIFSGTEKVIEENKTLIFLSKDKLENHFII